MNYYELNKIAWNKKTELHLHADFYEMDAFLKGKNALKNIELDLLGDIKGKSILHLQCHFGQDTLSLARMGARVTGVDISDAAITKANELNEELQLDAEFICCNIFDLPALHDAQYDWVFTTYGTIGWLKDIQQWAKIVHRFLKPGGQFLFVDFHPVVWMYDNDFTKVEYSYFHGDVIVEEEKGSYGNRETDTVIKSAGWNHGVGEVIKALIHAGLRLKDFQEYNYSTQKCFPNMKEMEEGKYVLNAFGNKIPMLYSLVAEREVR